MEPLDVECLRCGEQHRLARARFRHLQEGECPRCGYLGWAGTSDVSERARRELRDRTVELRRLRLVA